MDIKFFDNINNRLVDDLHNQITTNSKLQIAAASFSIYAFEALKEELQSIEQLQFIFTSPTFTKDKIEKQKREFYIPKRNRERNLFGTEFEIRLRNQLSQRAIARECAQWIRQKVQFKTNISNGTIPNGFLNIIPTTQPTLTYNPLNEFTTTELGIEKGNQSITTTTRLLAVQNFIDNFNHLWNDTQALQDVTERIIEHIETVYRENSPEFIYFFTLYNIFHEFLEDISEDVLPNESTGFKTSLIWQKLYDFQKDAALAIINKLERYNGCILADSVGLGKTFTALAVIKYYETRNKAVLVLCPKKLNENWLTYRSNYRNNPLIKDRLRYDVFFHSDLSRDTGNTNGQELANINWGNYDLIVIDESHNFRNGGKITTDENDENPRENRYLRLMNKVIKQGVQTKVLMLSATPVNNRFNDLKNQLKLAYEGQTENINHKLNTTHSIDDIFRQAQKAYNQWNKLPSDKRTTQQLLNNLDFDFFQLLDAVTIARSRKHIQKYYDTNAIGQFPTRLRPLSFRPPLTDINHSITFSEIAALLNQLNLAIYAPSFYILDSQKYKYELDDPDNNHLSMAGREKGIRKLMAINLLKRLESSVNSFRLTLKRIKQLIDTTLIQIEKYQTTHTEALLTLTELIPNNLDFEEADNDFIVGGKKTNINIADMDHISWQHDLKNDQETLDMLLLMLQDITPKHDSKLNLLIQNIQDKLTQPINTNNKKILIFTAFSDTAEYLYQQLEQPILKKYQLYTGLITGDTIRSNTQTKADFNTLLTLFSPISKEKKLLLPNNNEEVHILIATDCISEGQNLQDCDYLINYDIHWNPVRIIQRFGRIDRIGSKNQYIQLVNYWPDIELDEYISLKGRVESRMKASILTSTGDDNLLCQDEKEDLDYRRQQLQKLQNEIVDLEDMDNSISITDLGLDKFRQDLLAYIKQQGDEIEHCPLGMSAIVEHNTDVAPGVIFILKNKNNHINIGRLNQLHPFYMVHVNQQGNTITSHLNPKQLLDTMSLACKGKTNYNKTLCRNFDKQTQGGKHMEHYNQLLQAAIQSIIDIKQQNDIDSLFAPGETTAKVSDIQGLNDFELISFLIIQ